MENKLSIVPRKFIINTFSNISHDPMNTDCEILTSFFEDSIKISSNRSLIGCYLSEPVENLEEKPKKRSKLQRLKDLGLLGAIKDSEITSENYKKHLDDYFGNSCE